MTEKRFDLRLCNNGTYYVYENGTLTDIDFDKFNKESADALIDEVNALYDENEQLKKENQRMTDKLNELALEFLNYDMVSMGKATEISEMCYYDFLKYRKKNGNPMDLQL